MNTGQIVSTALVAGLVVTTGPVAAQDRESGLSQRLRIEQNFSSGDNLGLEIPEEDRTSLSTTRLTYGLDSITRFQRFSFVIGGSLRAGSIAQGNSVQTGATDPLIGLRYFRESANASLNIEAEARQTDVSAVGGLFNFLDEDGAIQLPADFSRVQGTGERQTYNFGLDLQLNRNGPVTFIIDLGADGTRYNNNTDPSLVDFDRANIGLGTVFALSSTDSVTLNLDYARYQAENALRTDKRTTSYSIGFSSLLNDRTTLSASLGQSEVDTTEGGVLRRTTGPTANLSLVTELPNGQFGSSLNVSQNSDGGLSTLRFTRDWSLPLGSFSANIGATRSELTNRTRLVGGLNWLHQRPTSQITLKLNRDVLFDANDEQRFTTELVGGYRQEINDVSNLALNLSLFQSEAGTTSNAVDRGDLKVTYERELNSDWSFNTGLNYRYRDENTVGRAKSTSVFFGIGRNFNF